MPPRRHASRTRVYTRPRSLEGVYQHSALLSWHCRLHLTSLSAVSLSARLTSRSCRTCRTEDRRNRSRELARRFKNRYRVIPFVLLRSVFFFLPFAPFSSFFGTPFRLSAPTSAIAGAGSSRGSLEPNSTFSRDWSEDRKHPHWDLSIVDSAMSSFFSKYASESL